MTGIALSVGVPPTGNSSSLIGSFYLHVSEVSLHNPHLHKTISHLTENVKTLSVVCRKQRVSKPVATAFQFSI